MAEFFDMGGYAVFVWSAFGLWFACVVFNIVSAQRKIRLSLARVTEAAQHQQRRLASKTEPKHDT